MIKGEIHVKVMEDRAEVMVGFKKEILQKYKTFHPAKIEQGSAEVSITEEFWVMVFNVI